MNTPEIFNGVIYPLAQENNYNLKLLLYRRETNKRSLKEFLDSIKKENLAYDKVNNNLYYRDMDNNLYELKFKPMKEGILTQILRSVKSLLNYIL